MKKFHLEHTHRPAILILHALPTTTPFNLMEEAALTWGNVQAVHTAGKQELPAIELVVAPHVDIHGRGGVLSFSLLVVMYGYGLAEPTVDV